MYICTTGRAPVLKIKRFSASVSVVGNMASGSWRAKHYDVVRLFQWAFFLLIVQGSRVWFSRITNTILKLDANALLCCPPLY